MPANPTACGGRATVSGRASLIPFFLTQLSTMIQVWTERSRQRRELGELADRNDLLLADIGLSVEEARHEAAKPFWAFSERTRGPSACTHGRQDAWPRVMNTPGGVTEHPIPTISRARRRGRHAGRSHQRLLGAQHERPCHAARCDRDEGLSCLHEMAVDWNSGRCQAPRCRY